MGMPLGRYFAFTGSLLVALLFLADWYMPKLVATSASAGVDKTTIRIHTAHRWPEAIVIDTSLPTLVPAPAILIADAPAGKLPQETRSPRDALALATADAAPAPPTTMQKPVHKRRVRTARIIIGRGAGEDMYSIRTNFATGW